MKRLFRKKLEENKVENEVLSMLEFYKASFEFARDTKIVLLEGKIVKFNFKALELFETEDGALLGGKPFFTFVEEGTTEDTFLFAQKPQVLSIVIRTPKGTLKDVSLTTHPLYINGKEYVFLTMRDITEIEELRTSHELLEKAIDVTMYGMVITNILGEIIWVNDAYIAKTEFSINEIIGQNPRILKSTLTDPNIFKELWSTISSGKIWKGTVINKTKSGKIFTDNMTIVPMIENGVITHYVALKFD